MAPEQTSELLGEALVHLRAINAQLERLLERMPDPHAPLPEAVEWESLDGMYRTTDKAIAANWAGAIGVRVVRRAPGVTASGHQTKPAADADGQAG